MKDLYMEQTGEYYLDRFLCAKHDHHWLPLRAINDAMNDAKTMVSHGNSYEVGSEEVFLRVQEKYTLEDQVNESGAHITKIIFLVHDQTQSKEEWPFLLELAKIPGSLEVKKEEEWCDFIDFCLYTLKEPVKIHNINELLSWFQKFNTKAHREILLEVEASDGEAYLLVHKEFNDWLY